MQEPLQVVSNVIELKPDKKYLLVFSGDFKEGVLQGFMDILNQHHLYGIGVALTRGQELTVIEVPSEAQHAE